MKKKITLFLSFVMISAALTGCGGNSDKDSQTTTTEETTEQTTQDNNNNQSSDLPLELPQLEEIKKGESIAVIHTNQGDIKVRFFPEYAPKAVENFLTHAKDGYYNGVIFHRVIKDFMIQGGDPEGTGRGGESIWGEPFENEETSNLRSFRGALCMANAGADTNGSQFYIVQNKELDSSLKTQFEELLTQQEEYVDEAQTTKVKDIYPTEVINEYIKNGGTPHLDQGYTIFGQVYEGLDIVDKIADVETDENDKPKEDIIIETIEVGTYE